MTWRAFISEYGRFSATKTVWTAFAIVFLVQLTFQGITITTEWFTWAVTFSGTDCAAVLGAQGAIYAWRRGSECKHGRPDDPERTGAA
ncbi:hypothetical protein [Algiphilus sp.]|uniref:hypothetical protein n=1 Tax=Algiphilus sp. TaxID=1872431 RepID=UPI0025B7BEF5|nr:hypothetical protein [Algiphilus sp.]MCK5772010.1 hypothetical protein [Algiphilus sp.]